LRAAWKALIEIRIADAEDAEAISSLVIRTLRGSNVGDYDPDHIATLVAGFSPMGVLERMTGRRTFVALRVGEVVGVASLGDRRVHTVFISPELQKQGIGAALMARVEALAQTCGMISLTLRSSKTAEGFYQKLGYQSLRVEMSGLEQTIVMNKELRR
jgi:GNAT superfamily N-acetyltransferase